MTVNITHFDGLSLEENVKNNFKQADMEAALAHILQTRYNAITLAKRFGCDPEQAASTALLHDLGRLVPAHEYLDLAETFNLEILPEEKQFPDLLHQKLSRVIAVETFNITDKEVLNAVACHTTLRPNAARLDKILFLADKLAAVPGKQPAFMPLVIKQLEKSLDDAVYCYLFNYLQNGKMPIVHPWLRTALEELTPRRLAG